MHIVLVVNKVYVCSAGGEHGVCSAGGDRMYIGCTGGEYMIQVNRSYLKALYIGMYQHTRERRG